MLNSTNYSPFRPPRKPAIRARPCSIEPRVRAGTSALTPIWLIFYFAQPVWSKNLQDVFADAIKAKVVVGAQILEGSMNRTETDSINMGFTSPDRVIPVTHETLFCIASCSKPLISCLIFRLTEQQTLDIEAPIDHWLSEFNNPHLASGRPTGPPSLKQLLAHRAGIYSQKERMSREQQRAIRDFTITLSQSVKLIADQPLQSEPGTRYAYSGAGYCLIGAVAEKATQTPIEELLKTQLLIPLGMNSTTFFPQCMPDRTVATGGFYKSLPPHLLGERLRLPLIGGSLHTTAEDLERFARMVAARGTHNNGSFLKPATWTEYVSKPYRAQRYGYGWTRAENGDQILLSHNGSLPPAQAMLQINLQTRNYKIALWTLADPKDSEVTSTLRAQIRHAIRGA